VNAASIVILSLHPTTPVWVDLVYLAAAVAFIVALKGLSSPKQARNGNILAAAAAVVAVAVTFFNPVAQFSSHTTNLILAIIAMVLGAAIAVPVARLVKMTAMPQLVAIFNGVGGGAAALISIVVFLGDANLHTLGGAKPAVYAITEGMLGLLIGCVSFSGSAIAFIKLQELITGRPITYPGQQVINGLVGVAIVALAVATVLTDSVPLMIATAVLSLVLGVIFVLPIGGADVPVLISLLNSFTGLAVAASGFTLNNNLLIIAGTLVGASGILLTRMMSKAMGRSLSNVLFSAFGAVVTAGGGADGAGETRQVKSGTAEDIGVLLAYARKVVIIPGYGLAVAQAQHTARELADLLMAKGVEVFYAIHPVAGRMPGHMNVLLAEANVPYDELKEMDEANPEMSTCDVALVVGANDTVNPAAKNTPGSPIYGMPIINADEAGTVIFLKRSMRPGFAGIDNDLLFDDKTTLLFGDAKDTLGKLVKAVEQA
jgi:NAD(P) transhydrogenase subunit beta